MTRQELIDSGVLELYVMGIANQRDQEEVEMMAAIHPEIREEMMEISAALEEYALAKATEPSRVVKPMLMATIDYSERIKNGERVSFPPKLHENSTAEDFASWLNRPDMNISISKEDDIIAKLIGYTPEMTTAIVWINRDAPREIHDNELESFLILEGTCDIIVGNKINSLIPGDYFTIPLHEYHQVKVTSSFACKAILQRVAA